MSTVTPILRFISTPSSLAAKSEQKFNTPVSRANIDDSTFCGISLANSTIAGSTVKAETNVSITVLVRTTKVRGLSPKVIYFTNSIVVIAPSRLRKQAVIIIFLIGTVFKKLLYIKVEKNRQTNPSTESKL